MPAGAEEMAVRRQIIVDAAENLIRRTGAVDFTMAALAKAAGVSLATPYNLFDAKAAILYALLNRSMDGIDDVGRIANAEADPFVRVMRSAEAVAQFFTADSKFYRVLYRFLLGVDDPVHRPAFMERANHYWACAIAGLDEAGLLLAEVTPDQLALELLTSFVGATDLWVHGELSDEAFVARTGYSALLLTYGLAHGRSRAIIVHLLQERRSSMPEKFSFHLSGDESARLMTGRAATRKGIRTKRPA